MTSLLNTGFTQSIKSNLSSIDLPLKMENETCATLKMGQDNQENINQH